MRQFAIALALIGACLLAIHLVFGLDQLVNFSEKKKFNESETQETGTVIPIKDNSGKNTNVSIIARGRVHLPQEKDLLMPDGSILKLPVYVLDAEDNEPVADSPGEILLHRVEVKFFKIINKSKESAQAIHSATLHARQAFIHLGKSSDGTTTVLGDRDIRLYDVHLETTPNAPIQDLEMNVAELYVRQSERGTELRTPTDFMPFEILLGGANPMTLVGDGLTAFMPNEEEDAKNKTRDVTAKDAASKNSTSDGSPSGDRGIGDRGIELHVARNPVLTGNNFQLRAEGAFDYIEDYSSGSAKVTMNRGVEVEFESTEKKGVESLSPKNIVARCNSLYAELLRFKKDKTKKKAEKKSAKQGRRSKNNGRNEMGGWRRIELRGAQSSPVTVTAEQGVLHCKTLEALPSADGQPYLLIASGDPELTHTAAKTGEVTVFTAEHRINLVRVESLLRPLHPAFAGPLVPRLTQNLVIFEGAATVKRGDLTLTADKGLRILQASRDQSLRLIVGVGGVEVDQADLHVASNMGFTLSQKGEEQILRLGPAEDDPSHRFHVKKLGDQALTLDGTGFCRMVRSATKTTIFIRSPKEDLIVDTILDDKPAHIEDINTLTAHLKTEDNKEILTGFVAEGKRCHLKGAAKDRQFEGYANRIVSPAGVDTTLFGSASNPAILIEGDGSVISGPRIELHPLLDEKLVVQVYGDATNQASASFKGKKPSNQKEPKTAATGDAQSTGPLEVAGSQRSTVTLKSDELHWLPYLLPPIVLHAHGRSLYRNHLFARNLAAPHILAKNKVTFYVTTTREGEEPGTLIEQTIAQAKGDLFVMRVNQRDGARQHGFLRGHPASFSNTTQTGREAEGQAKTVQFSFVDENDYNVEFISEEQSETVLLLSGDPKGQKLDIDKVRVTCKGDIRGDARTIRFLGPVRIQGLKDDGSIDPEGIDLRAKSMVIERRDEVITKITASGDVIMQWSKIHARGDELVLKPQSNICTVKDSKNGAAVVSFPNGLTFIGNHIEANYITRSHTIWDLRSPGLSPKTGLSQESISLKD